MMMLNTTSKNAETSWAWAARSTTLMTPRPSFTIYFRRSSSTRVRRSREAQIATEGPKECFQMLPMPYRKLTTRAVHWTKGRMLIPEWVALTLQTPPSPTLIWTVPMALPRLMLPIMSLLSLTEKALNNNLLFDFKLYLCLEYYKHESFLATVSYY